MDLACSDVDLTKNSITHRLAKISMSVPTANVIRPRLNVRTPRVVSTAPANLALRQA